MVEVVDVAVLIEPTYSKRSPSGKLGGAGAERFVPTFRKFVIAETADERPGADVDGGFAATESELTVYSGEAAVEGDACREWHRHGACAWHRQGCGACG